MFEISESYIVIEEMNMRVFGIKSENLTINNISSDYQKIEKLVAMLNEENPSSIHINEIIDDYILEM